MCINLGRLPVQSPAGPPAPPSTSRLSHKRQTQESHSPSPRILIVGAQASQSTLPRMYQTLDTSTHEIRLLRLLPGNLSDSIETELITTTLDIQSIPFEALSYVWGQKSNPPNQIVVDNTPKDVTENLHSALRGLRRDDQSRMLWVDAVCVNQEDILERNQQVRLMHRIYAGATRVVVWLGDFDRSPSTPRGADDSGSHADIAAIDLLTSSDDIHWNDKSLTIEGVMLVVTSWLGSDWWYRVWTVQEAAVAQSLVYMLGRVEVQGEKLKRLYESFNLHGSRSCCDTNQLLPGEVHILLHQSLPDVFEKFQTLESLGKKLEKQERGGPALSPSYAAALCRPRNATDPRDKVYAFAGLSRGFPTSWIDYSLSVGLTFETAARECVVFTKRLGVLSFCHYFSAEEVTQTRGVSSPLPSWVPDWTLQYDRNAKHAMARRQDIIDYWMMADAPRGWLASGVTACEAVISQQDPPGHLGVSGRSFDSVAVIGEPHLNAGPIYHKASHNWRLLSGVDKNPMSPYVGGGSRLAAYKRVLTMNTSFDGKEKVYSRDDDMAHDEWWYGEMCGLNNLEDREHLRYKQTPVQHRWGRLVVACSIGRAFFISEKGYFGFAPSTAQVGDQICILAGGQTPYILRRAGEAVLSDSGTVPAFKLVGDSYVHGIMHGEAMADVDEGKVSLERWTLI
ncbi:hypothetical protein MAPG_10738 [Magnaporthiopsis poae ATCC 64411]|uniref:Heterokaryon incompatibility domain-containing protein n=1 Tax=Magnaporthiopsis poae (strain ATCC 64411 / 73-15) TaxID=644358 RepID=A0A0C4EDE0_MAGP6|nr:hypothetical protein MAPG_10738 [Magnaporthiopsis poae ATCC 64411]